MLVTSGQIDYEFQHLLGKLKVRDPNLYLRLKDIKSLKLHPMFKRIKGDVADWEIVG